jgi:hypothetical protein
MKKVLLFLVALMLMVTFGAQAQTLELTYEGVTFTLPDDFVLDFEEDGDTVSIHTYTSESLEHSFFIIGVSTVDGQPNPNTEEALLAHYEEIANDLHEASYEVKQIGDFTVLSIKEGTNSEIIYITQANGIVVQITCIASGELTQAQIDAVDAIAVSMQIAPTQAE